MRLYVRKLLAHVLDDEARRSLKRVELSARKRLSRLGPEIGPEDLRQLLGSELGVARGATVMVHASASLLNTRLSPSEIVAIILDVIGPKGTLAVPTFPATSSLRYMQQPGLFDARSERSGMGAISEAVRRMPEAARSTHPVKSIAVVGADARAITAGHEACLYPFGQGSPYQKLLARDVRIIGIGAPMSYLSFVHVAEDLAPDRVTKPVWEDAVYEKDCLDLDGQSHRVRAKVHNMTLMQKANPERFCRRHIAEDAQVILRRGMADFFAVDGRALTDAVGAGWIRGMTIYD